MRKTLLVLLALVCIAQSHAQVENRDSIKHLLRNATHDTSRVLLLADLSYTYLHASPDSTMLLALQALSLAQRIGYEKGIAASLNRIGNSYGYVGNYPKAMEAFLAALKINNRINNQDGEQRNVGNIGFIYLLQEDYRQALNYSFRAKDLAAQIDNKFNVCLSLGQIADAYYYLGVLDSARLYAQMDYDLATKLKFWVETGRSLQTLGRIHYASGQYPLALEYYRLSISVSNYAKSEYGLSSIFIDVAKLFEKLNQSDSLLLYAHQSLSLAQDRAFTKEVKDAAEFLYTYYHNQRNADSTLYYFTIAKAANDSLFSQQKQRHFQSLAFDERLRQQELQMAKAKAKEERKHNLQYGAIALGLLIFLMLFFVFSHSIVANQKLIRFLGVLLLLIVFEFINLFIHPFLDRWTHHSIPMMLAIMVCIAALLIPLHHKLEHWITHKLVEKNNRIRLAAAKKTIQELEQKNTVSLNTTQE